MIPYYQIPRNTLLWLFVTQILVLLPHLQRTPAWIIVLLIASMLWRIQVFRGRWSFPPKKIKIPLTLVSCLGLVFSFPTFFGLDALVGILLTAYALKLLEMYYKRDALILLYLSFFLVMTGFLFDQSILLAVFNLLVLCVIVTTLKSLYQQAGHERLWHNFRHASAMVLQALPLMVLMFVLLPRFPTFWNIPLQKNSPKTGMNDSMSPGDFSRLAQNADPVMRITFVDQMPEKKELYWRGLTFSKFDGRRWQVDEALDGKPKDFVAKYKLTDNNSSSGRKDFLQKIQSFGLYEDSDAASGKTDYEIILEGTGTPWLYALQHAIPNTPDILVSYDQLLEKNGVVTGRFKYDVTSYLSRHRELSLPDWQHKLQTRLPDHINPRARERAQQWLSESGSAERYIDRLLSWYHDDFYYTLQPPALGSNSVDEFLFDSKKGFCEHFASSFVFMLRAAGIPARVVVGYQGGELNPYERYLLVRQYDAHAWAEVWLDGKGWVRYDPTFAVAPQRILDGFRNAFDNKDELKFPILSLARYPHVALLNALRLQWDRVNYDWSRWVLSYDSERQINFMTQLFGEYSVARVAGFFISITTIFLLLTYGFLLWQERDKTPDPVLRKYRKLSRQLNKVGFAMQDGETPDKFLRRLAVADPARFSHFADISTNLYQYWYQDAFNSDEEIAKLCKQMHV